MWSFKLNSRIIVISLSILLLSVAVTSTNFAIAGTPEEEAAQEAKKAAEEAASAAEQAASDAESAASQAASDAESAASQAASDAESAASQAASDAEAVAEAASDAEAVAEAASDADSDALQAASDALKKEKIKIFLSIKNNLSQIDQKNEKESLGDIKPMKNGKIKDRKIDTKMSKLISSKDPESYAKKKGFDFYEGDTRLMIKLNEIDDTTLEKIKTLGTIEISKGDKIQIKIPTNKISQLVSISEIKNIKSTLLPIQNRDIVIDGRIIEDSVFSKKYKSKTPVNVAIIDLAFDENNVKIKNNIIENISFRYLFENYESAKINNYENLHGTAMAQIITNMLPDVKLYLFSAGTELEFMDAVDYAISKDVDIITIGYTWINYDTDGTSAITKKVEDAVKSEITVVVPSGNYAENYWKGVFKDTDGDKWHEFSNMDEGMTITVDKKRIEEKRPIL